MTQIICRHCETAIEKNPNPEEYMAWLHVATGSAKCRQFYAAPGAAIVVNVTNPPPRDRIVYVSINRGGGGMLA